MNNYRKKLISNADKNSEKEPYIRSIYDIEFWSGNSEFDKEIMKKIENGADLKKLTKDELVGVIGNGEKEDLIRKKEQFNTRKVFLFYEGTDNLENILKYFFDHQIWGVILGSKVEFKKLKNKFSKVNNLVFYWDDNPKITLIKEADSLMFIGQIEALEKVKKLRNEKEVKIHK